MKPLDINKNFVKVTLQFLIGLCTLATLMLIVLGLDLQIKQLQKDIDYNAVKTIDYNNASCVVVTLPNQLRESIFCTNK